MKTKCAEELDSEPPNAKKRRLCLSEVYVHKYTTLSTDANDDERFEVFHIFELDEKDTKIVPKLSTNCTEPAKIIEILQNFTGSDTPQLQRLISKLTAQSAAWSSKEKWKTYSDTAKTPDSQNKAHAPGMDDRTTVEKLAQSKVQKDKGTVEPLGNAISAQMDKTVQLVPHTEKLNMQLGPITKIVPEKENAQPVQLIPPETPTPVIRVRPMESLIDKSKPKENCAPTPPHAASVKVSAPPSAASVNSSAPPSSNELESNVTNASVKIWNKLMQLPGCKGPTYLVIPKSQAISVSKEAIQQKTTTIQTTPSQPVITTTVSSMPSFKIDQVFGNVSDDFVKELANKKTPSNNPIPPKVYNPKPNLNASAIRNLVQRRDLPTMPANVMTPQSEKANPSQAVNKSQTTSIQNFDLRCNFCLNVSKTFSDHKQHMHLEHGCGSVCETCHTPFADQTAFDGHQQNGSCVKHVNSSRPYLCIIDPPVIMMRQNAEPSFRCKHCSQTFSNQRNYARHAQLHATKFRCKNCSPSRPMSQTEMKEHLKAGMHFIIKQNVQQSTAK